MATRLVPKKVGAASAVTRPWGPEALIFCPSSNKHWVVFRSHTAESNCRRRCGRMSASSERLVDCISKDVKWGSRSPIQNTGTWKIELQHLTAAANIPLNIPQLQTGNQLESFVSKAPPDAVQPACKWHKWTSDDRARRSAQESIDLDPAMSRTSPEWDYGKSWKIMENSDVYVHLPKAAPERIG